MCHAGAERRDLPTRMRERQSRHPSRSRANMAHMRFARQRLGGRLCQAPPHARRQVSSLSPRRRGSKRKQRHVPWRGACTVSYTGVCGEEQGEIECPSRGASRPSGPAVRALDLCLGRRRGGRGRLCQAPPHARRQVHSKTCTVLTCFLFYGKRISPLPIEEAST